MSLLGNRVARTEDPRFLDGSSRYVADIAPEGCAHVVYVRSQVAHAQILGIETDEAAAMPGVLAVVTGADLDLPAMAPRIEMHESAHAPLLATERVRFVGEPLAVVVATTQAAATDAAELVLADLDILDPVVTMDQAVAGDIVLYPAIGSNVVTAIAARSEIDFSACEVVATATISNQRIAAAPLEPRVGAADWTGDRLTFWASTQGAGVVKEALKRTYGLDDDALLVICPDVGGGFGAKGSPGREELLLPELSRRVGRAVLWAETRSENMVAMVQGRGQQQTLTIGGTAAGTITHYALHVVQDCGAYGEIGGVLPGLTMMMMPGTYEIENVQFSSQSVVTNTTPIGAFRGAGRPEAAAAVERAVDLFAAEAGLDPVAVRRTNLMAAFAEPRRNAFGTQYDVGDFPAALATVLDHAGYDALRREQAARRQTGETNLLGIGVASYVEITAIGGPDGISEYGRVVLNNDGTVTAYTGSTPHGQGHETAWAMVISDQLGVAFEHINVVFGNTDEIPSTNTTGGSRSAQVAGSAMLDASVKLVDLARVHAADVLEANIDDVVLDTDAGVFHVAGTPAVSIDWATVAAAVPAPLVALSDFVQPRSSFPFGAHVAVVEVDIETGKVTLQRLVAVDDCGTILNPMLADGQVHGGLGAGVAQALIEEVLYDENGTPMTSNFADYGVISATELPSFERIEMVTPTPLNPIGAKGIGESGSIGSTPAVQNAVVDAVAHLGIRHIDIPTSPQRVWNAIQAARP